ncbi:MAG: hypothetical protein UR69_C0001G0116 [Candidatus Moranbacteria bacterium GW2011_GWE2_35_2-]|nr:MAG: hypothetical protein UR69_C0001G0116 [Candidatus Moranbacteria bacterium GW2011_GWE2_35_2-]KKQ04877.1 MAG: hypothetical protein US15_C0040G0006 [Candidatus Moranbacteria bacterium GW2011_GWF1_36_4]KKQ22886.1 MAG: hypothetical protein US37_C0001G0158 [Candidatus Moranbacteria bacterium GW2011_GWF2_37_11]KKQ29244.1 MAG: hypothetical protein US44_C0002G0026 [Candidatus Moranbacteria bacterium GW2011_GWD1_37_17]KKQ30883.1 MAG: hypothetical protein US47_C0001G0116 [Candidatus Moranbacteria b
MALNNLSFRGKLGSSVGNISRDGARSVIDENFKDLDLSHKAKDYFSRKMDDAGNIEGRKFNSIVDQAQKNGLISHEKAEKIKDRVDLPDNLNEHWN